MSTIIIIFYISLRNTSETKIYLISSYVDYKNLLNEYSSNQLSCPCTIISIKYSNILSIQPKSIHPACYDGLFIQNWRRNQHRFNNISIENSFSIILFFYIRLTNSLCQTSGSFVTNQLEQFDEKIYTTSYLTDREQFENYFNLQIKHLQTIIPLQLRRLVQILNTIISSNSLMSVANINYEWNFVYSDNPYISIQQIIKIIELQTKTKYYQNQTCSCQTQSKLCKQEIYLPKTNISVPGLYLGCYFINGLLKSTWECLYNVACLNLLQFHMLPEFNITQFVLKSPLNSFQYKINSTVEELIDVAFVGEWFSNISYESYYNKCKPEECHITFIKKFSLIYIITTTISILSGIVKVFQVLIPQIIKIFYKLYQHYKRRKFIRRLTNKNRINPIKPSLST